MTTTTPTNPLDLKPGDQVYLQRTDEPHPRRHIIRVEHNTIWADPIGRDNPVRLPNPHVEVLRIIERADHKRCVWWCNCGSAANRAYSGERAEYMTERSLKRHKRTTKCDKKGGVGFLEDEETRVLWARAKMFKKRTNRDSEV